MTNDSRPGFLPGEQDIYARRRGRLREKLRERCLDAMLVSLAANRFYLSGFELHDVQTNESSGHLIISASGDDWLATDSRYEITASEAWPGNRVLIYGGDSAAALAGLLAKCGSRIGLEPGGLGWGFARRLMSLAPRPCPAFEAVDCLVEQMRMIKDDWEIELIKKSFALNHQMLAWLEKEIAKPSPISEKELSWAIERYFRENGAQELAFASIVASGKHAALPHAIPGDEIINRNAPLLVDVGCRVENYCSDQTRSFWPDGAPSKEFSRALELVREAQAEAMDIMRPGAACADVYAAAMDVFKKAGVEKAFTHGLGHGVGLETHEAPSLSGRSGAILRKGMVVTVEPGLYYPQWGGVRWENTVLVEEGGISLL